MTTVIVVTVWRVLLAGSFIYGAATGSMLWTALAGLALLIYIIDDATREIRTTIRANRCKCRCDDGGQP